MLDSRGSERKDRMLLERQREGGDRLRRRYRELPRPRPQLQLWLSSSLLLRTLPSAAQGQPPFTTFYLDLVILYLVLRKVWKTEKEGFGKFWDFGTLISGF